MSSSKNKRYSTFSPAFEAYLKQRNDVGTPQLASLSLPEIRKSLQEIEESAWVTKPDGIKWDDVVIPTSDGASISLRIHEQASTQGIPKDVAIMVHGGGWSLGGAYSDSFLTRALAKRLDMIVVTIDYRLAPEHLFPTAYNDCLDAFRWTLKSSYLRTSPDNRITFAGFSAGGNLVAAITQWAAANGLRNSIKAQILISPATCHYKQLPKARSITHIELDSIENASSPLLTADQYKAFWDKYYPSGGDDLRASPLLSTFLTQLPPTYIQVSGADPLRDEGLAYARLLEQANIQVGLDIYPGMPHAYQSEVLAIPGREKTMEDMTEWLESLEAS